MSKESKGPVAVNLSPGVHFWCRCGESEKHPFCDGTHKITNYDGPKRFQVEEASSVYLCGCGHTKQSPYCDGTHKQI